MKKILFYINSINYGGAERVLVNLANTFSNNDYDVVLVTSFEGEKEYVLDEKVNRKILEKTQKSQYFIKKNAIRISRLRKILKNEKPDIVISFMAEANFRSIIATRFLGIKTLISVRNDPNREYGNKLFEIMARILFPMASGCVFQTEDAQKWFYKKVQKKSRIILNQVNEIFYETEEFNGVREGIVSVGRLEAQKNYDLLIDAFSEIIKNNPNEQLLIYGEGNLKGRLIEKCKKLNVENNVHFMGAVSEIQERIKGAKMFVLASNYEGLPNVVMEAMTLGLPIVCTDCPCGGPKMLIQNNESGILVRINDKNDMVQAMNKILLDKEFSKRISLNAKREANKFKPYIIFNQWKDYVEELLR